MLGFLLGLSFGVAEKLKALEFNDLDWNPNISAFELYD